MIKETSIHIIMADFKNLVKILKRIKFLLDLKE